MAAAGFRHRRGCFLSRRTGEDVTTGPRGASALAAVATLPPVRALPWRSVRQVSVRAGMVRRIPVRLWTWMVRRLQTRMVWVSTWSVLGLVVRPSESTNRKWVAMSALGPKRTWVGALRVSALGGKADMTVCESPLSQSLLGVERTLLFAAQMSPFDPKRT
jgi:hypothetical protein